MGAWIESHQTVWEHAKTRKAARRLGIDPVQLVGHLHSLWHWALDHAEDGNLSKYDPDDLAVAARWDGDPDEFVAALTDCGPGGTAGFLDRGGPYGDPADALVGDLVLHDWWDYAGKLIASRQRSRDGGARGNHVRHHVEKGVVSADCPFCPAQPSPPDSGGDSGGDRGGDRLPLAPRSGSARTEPNPTQPDQPPSPPSGARGARGRRLPDDWRPEPEPELVAALGGQDAAKAEFAKFRDYWHAKPGKDGRKVDWQATWRNWIRRAAEQRPRQPAGARASPAAQPSTFTQSRRLQ